MAVDLGRMFIAKNETQAYCDAAALAAALALNGASSGITAAQNAVANTKNAWNLDSAYITNYQVAFATGVGGPWDGNPNPAALTHTFPAPERLAAQQVAEIAGIGIVSARAFPSSG